jgi:glycosyltransferase 2 family protein
VKRWRMGLLGGIISLLAIYFVLKQVNVVALGEALAQARYAYLVPTVLFLLIGLVTRAVRWRILLSGGILLSRAFSIMNVAYLVNGTLPLRIGELARIYLATRSEPPIPAIKTASTIIVERLLDLLAVTLLVALALAGGPIPDEVRAVALASAPLSLGGFLLMILMASHRDFTLGMLARLVDRVPFLQWLLQRFNLTALVAYFLDGLQPLGQMRTLLQALGWTAVSWGFSCAAGYILMFAFYDQASWSATMLYIAAAAFVIAVPAVPGNLGPYELSVVVAVTAMGYSDLNKAAAFGVIVHGINLAVHATTGIIGFVNEGISLEKLSQGVQDMRRQQPRTVTQDVVVGE